MAPVKRGRLLPGIGSHHSASPQTDEWLTPPHLLQAFRDVGHVFDLDPCYPVEGIPWAHLAPERTFTRETDGLHEDWLGSVWLNPPYSEVEPWMERLAKHGAGVALVFARCETRWWFESVWPHATGFLFLAGRVTFHHADGERSKAGHNSGGPSVLVAYGHREFFALQHLTVPGALVAAPLGVRRA